MDAKAIDVLMDHARHEWSEIHHIESQRAGLTNILLVIESGAVALVIQGNYALVTLPICGLLLVCGTIGLLATKKYYERFKFAETRLTETYRRIDELCSGAGLLDALRKANMKHNASSDLAVLGYHLKRLRLYKIWIVLHAIFVVASVVLGIIVLFRHGA
jgi:hypothetical protein